MLTPTFRNLNLSTILARRKNSERRPIMAKIFEKNTTNGSSDTENTAGIESSAKMTSVN